MDFDGILTFHSIKNLEPNNGMEPGQRISARDGNEAGLGRGSPYPAPAGYGDLTPVSGSLPGQTPVNVPVLDPFPDPVQSYLKKN